MLKKLLQLTFEISVIFIFGTLLSVVFSFYLSETLVRILFTVVYPFLAVLLFQNINFNQILRYSEKTTQIVLLKLMWIGILALPFYILLYSSEVGDISIDDVSFLTLLSLFVVAYCTFFKNSSSGFTSLFVYITFMRDDLPILSAKEFTLLMCTGLLMCIWLLLSARLTYFFL